MEATSTATTAPGSGGSSEMCRLIIIGPSSRVELAVPAHVAIADLMPTVLGHLDPTLATSGMEHGGWVLQRLGEEPLDEDKGTAEAGLYDGDMLYLRPRDDQLPVADFDDLVDGVHTGLSGRGDTWRPAFTYYTSMTTAAVCALLAIFVCTFAATGTGIAIGAATVSLLLLAGAAGMSQYVRDSGGQAATLAGVGVFAAAVAGLAFPGADAPPAWIDGPGILSAGVAIAVSAVLARVSLKTAKPAFQAVAAGGVLTALGGVLTVLVGLDGASTAAIVTILAVALTRAAPNISAWLGGLSVEPVPTTQDEFQEGLDPLPGEGVLDRASLTDTHLTSILGVLGGLCTGGLIALGSVVQWDTILLTALISVLLLLQAREVVGIWHRVSALVPAGMGLTVLMLGWSASMPVVGRMGVLLGLLSLSGLAVAAAHTLPGKRLIPRWGRWGDILQWICALAVLPILLSVIGVYGWVASLL
ncbi:type VII secretion integral membrane protein EccD [Saccharopolyspora elongata]|uniref:Type VII secretion integral membrane protein EccD n=1 Tax=Saccharopolyspora elongata TaxID=2530387 RepID=A0A4R4Y4W8_9PSEU|nr:type VII secretion integral membrane protein EccD [Saccharopolyspora elongata]TDD39315.1 type VII secretion integral membrane protein EccD [Saccharopolyspora elongata]